MPQAQSHVQRVAGLAREEGPGSPGSHVVEEEWGKRGVGA